MYRILISDELGAAGLEHLDQADDAAYDIRLGLSQDELLVMIGDYDALLMRSGTRVNAELLAAADRLKVIGRAGIGIDNVDVAAATMKGVIVMNTPTANSVATAEQTMALMLAVSRHIRAAHASLVAGEWRRSDFTGRELRGKTLGIIGFGHVGRMVAARAQAFGMEVVACDPYVSEEIARQHNVLLVDLDDLLPMADYVTLHTALTAETEDLINKDTLDQMKDSAILINVARGKLVDEAALYSALQNGRLFAAGLDVFRLEPPLDNPLIGHPNVLHTPHLGASTVEAQRDVALQIAQQVLDALRGTDYRNAVNIPFAPGVSFNAIRPYLVLGETLGAFQRALTDGPIHQLDVEVRGEAIGELVRPIAAALLKGLLQAEDHLEVNYINAPVLAHKYGIQVAQTSGMNLVDYSNLISCRVHTDGAQRTISGVLFGGTEPRVVQVDQYKLDIRPQGVVLILQNLDAPGVIGQVGTILGAYKINVGEWRMGRQRPGGEALSFINLDDEPSEAVLQALARIPAITNLKLLTF